MGKVKVLKDTELVGGTDNTSVYPVTSTKAVYNEDNKRLDDVLRRNMPINISTEHNNEHVAEVLTLSQAINKISSKDHTLGFQGKYLSTNGWHTIIYIGDSLNTWTDTTKWIDLDDKIFNSISKNATFAGIATPITNPGTPNGPVFYLATEVGVYPNFNNIEVTEGEAIIFKWDNGTWSKKVTGFATQEKLNKLESKTDQQFSQLGQYSHSILDSYSNININIDIVNGVLNNTQGYLFLGNSSAKSISSSNEIVFSSLSGLLYIVYSSTSHNLYIISYTDSLINDKDYVIGLIDKSNNSAIINCRRLIVNGAVLKNYTQDIYNTDSPNKCITSSLSVDFTNRIINFSVGYLFNGRYNFIGTINAGSITWDSSKDSLSYLVYSNSQHSLYKIVYDENVQNESDIIVGVIVYSIKKVFVNCASLIIDGNTIKDYLIQNFKSDSPNKYTTSEISINFSEGVLSFTQGYVFNGRYNEFYNLNSGSISFTTSKSLSYLVYSVSQLTLYIIEYTENVQNENDIIVGVISFINEIIIVNCKKLTINNKIITNFTLEEKELLSSISKVTPLPGKIITPTSDWPTKSFNSSSGTDGIFWDIRNRVSNVRRINKIYVRSSSAGTIRIHFLKLDGTTIYYEDYTVIAGVTEINPPALAYAQEMYVGAQNITSALQLVYPTDGTGQSRKKFLNDNHIVKQTYPYALWLSLNSSEDTLPVRVSNLESQSVGISTLQELKNALFLGISEIILKECDITLDSPLVIPTGTKIIGVRGKSILRVPSSVLKGIELIGIEDVVIENITLIGAYNGTPLKYALQPVKPGIVDSSDDAQQFINIGYQTDLTNGGVISESVPQIGININQCEKIEIIGCEIKNFSYYGIANALSGKNYRYACKFENNYINNCYCGLYLYKEAERSQYIANNISLCQIGLYLDSGTNMFTDNAFSANRIAMFMNNGVNHAHGVQTGNSFTHCSLFSLYAYNIENGEVFSQCKFGYVDPEIGNDYGFAIYLKNSRGLFFNNCQMISCSLTFNGKFKLHYTSYSTGQTDQFGNSNYAVSYTDIDGQDSQYNGGINQLLGCSFISGGGNITKSTDLDNTNIILKNNYFITGQDSSNLNN